LLCCCRLGFDSPTRHERPGDRLADHPEKTEPNMKKEYKFFCQRSIKCSGPAEPVVIKLNISICNLGRFYTQLPEKYEKQIKEVGITKDEEDKKIYGFYVSESLKKLLEKVSKYVEGSYCKELVKSRVLIKWAFRARLVYAKRKNGGIVPVEEWATNNTEYTGCGWLENDTTATEYGHYGYGYDLYCKPVLVNTYRFANGETVTEESRDFGQYINKPLSEIQPDHKHYNLIYLLSQRNMKFWGVSKDLKEIEYTEKRAAFFVGLLQNLALTELEIKRLGGLRMEETHSFLDNYNICQIKEKQHA